MKANPTETELEEALGGRYLLLEERSCPRPWREFKVRASRAQRNFLLQVQYFPTIDSREEAREILIARGDFTHPHLVDLVELLDIPPLGLGLIYPWLEVESLARADSHGFTIAQRLELGRQLGILLFAAQQEGYLFSGLHPGRLFPETLPAGEPFLRVTSSGGELHWNLVERLRPASLAFMSPEEALSGVVSPASTLYSYGGILFYLLTGRPPVPIREPREMLRALVDRELPEIRTSLKQLPVALVDRTTFLLEGLLHGKNPNGELTLIRAISLVEELQSQRSNKGEAATMEYQEKSIKREKRKTPGAAILKSRQRP